jgi:hypothetical protein
MADTAAHLVDRVIPAVPIRQRVVSLPYALRYRVAFDAALFTAVLGILIGTVFEFLERRAHDNGIPNAKCGAVAFMQRFGSAANLNPHAHILVLDGIYAALGGERPMFYPVRPPDAKDVTQVAERVAMRVAALLGKREGGAAPEPEEPAMAAIYGCSITGALATGSAAGHRVKTAGNFRWEGNFDERDERFENGGSRCAIVSGFSVHAGVSIRAEDRKGLERLVRYVARPPIAADRLSELPDGRLSFQLKTPWRNGTTHVIFERLEFMARLAALIPVPRKNLSHYYGVLGPAAKWRAWIVPAIPKIDSTSESCGSGEEGNRSKSKLPRNYEWSRLMARVFEFDVLKCPECNGRLKILAAIFPPVNTRKILECMGLPCRAPPPASAVSESVFEEF